jgi:hypothetical protein
MAWRSIAGPFLLVVSARQAEACFKAHAIFADCPA